MGKIFASSTLSHKSCIIYHYLRIILTKLQPPVKGVAIKIRKLFCEIEASSEPMRTSIYVRCLGLQNYEPGMQYDAHECLLQLLAKIYPINDDDCMFKINKLESALCNDCNDSGLSI